MGNRMFLLLVILLSCSASAHYITFDDDRFVSSMIMSQEPPNAGEEVSLFIQVDDLETGLPAILEPAHERFMHVLIIGQDLSTFAHIHPEDFMEQVPSENDTFELRHTFPFSGDNMVAIDYTVAGINKVQTFYVYGEGEPTPAPPDLSLDNTKKFEGYTVMLEAPEKIRDGTETLFTYNIRNDGADVRNLGTYLGAEMHVAIVEANLTTIAHTHAYHPGHGVHTGPMTQLYTGPNIPVRHVFDKPGTYVLFGQFMHDGKVITTRFVVQVKEPSKIPYRTILQILGIAFLLTMAYFIFRPRDVAKKTKTI